MGKFTVIFAADFECNLKLVDETTGTFCSEFASPVVYARDFKPPLKLQ